MLGEYHATFLAAEVLASSVHRNILCPTGRGCCTCNLSLRISVIATHFKIDEARAKGILDAAVAAACENDVALSKRRTKRNDATAKIDAAKKGKLKHFSDAEVETEAEGHGNQHIVLGKDLVCAIRKKAQDETLLGATSFGKHIPGTLAQPIADDLRAKLEAAAR